MNASVCIDRISAISSAQVPKCGRKSESSMPHSPCRVNFLALAASTAVSLGACMRLPFVAYIQLLMSTNGAQ